MMTRKDGVQQMGVRTAILALFIGFFLIITRVSSQAARSLDEQIDGAFLIPAWVVTDASAKAISVAEYGLQINLSQVSIK